MSYYYVKHFKLPKCLIEIILQGNDELSILMLMPYIQEAFFRTIRKEVAGGYQPTVNLQGNVG